MAKSDPPLNDVYDVLLQHFGPQDWWPGEGADETVIGAILVQNTAWTNAAKAIAVLKQAGAIDWSVLHAMPVDTLAEQIRPAGYYNSKAKKLKAFAEVVMDEFDGSLDYLFTLPDEALRKRLLDIWGIGPETADCILLYAAGRPVFVIDTYTRRMMERHDWADSKASYDTLSRLFTLQLQGHAEQYNEYHALLVALGKNFCRTKPMCDGCPLRDFLQTERKVTRT